MLSEPAEAVRGRAERLARTLEEALPAGAARIDVVPDTARAGGGALPLCDIDSHAVRIEFSRGDAQGCETFLTTLFRSRPAISTTASRRSCWP